MDDLISRKALLEELREAYDNAHRIFQNQNSSESQAYCKLQLRTLRSVIKAVKETPTIDAVKVVRCKDCKHRWTGACAMICDSYEWTVDDGFCNAGERWEDNG